MLMKSILVRISKILFEHGLISLKIVSLLFSKKKASRFAVLAEGCLVNKSKLRTLIVEVLEFYENNKTNFQFVQNHIIPQAGPEIQSHQFGGGRSVFEFDSSPLCNILPAFQSTVNQADLFLKKSKAYFKKEDLIPFLFIFASIFQTDQIDQWNGSFSQRVPGQNPFAYLSNYTERNRIITQSLRILQTDFQEPEFITRIEALRPLFPQKNQTKAIEDLKRCGIRFVQDFVLLFCKINPKNPWTNYNGTVELLSPEAKKNFLQGNLKFLTYIRFEALLIDIWNFNRPNYQQFLKDISIPSATNSKVLACNLN